MYFHSYVIGGRKLFLTRQISLAFQTTFRRNTPVFRYSCKYFTIYNSVRFDNFTFKQYFIRNSLLVFSLVWRMIPVNSKFFKD